MLLLVLSPCRPSSLSTPLLLNVFWSWCFSTALTKLCSLFAICYFWSHLCIMLNCKLRSIVKIKPPKTLDVCEMLEPDEVLAGRPVWMLKVGNLLQMAHCTSKQSIFLGPLWPSGGPQKTWNEFFCKIFVNNNNNTKLLYYCTLPL